MELPRREAPWVFRLTPPQAAQDRRSRGRNDEPRPLGLRRRLSRGRALRRPTRRAHAAWTLNHEAQRPLSLCRFLQRVQQCRSQCGENNRTTKRVRSQPAQTEHEPHRVLPEAILFESRGHGFIVQHGEVAFLGFGRRDEADGLQKPAIVEPVHPLESWRNLLHGARATVHVDG
jgi:hypothetical protein